MWHPRRKSNMAGTSTPYKREAATYHASRQCAGSAAAPEASASGTRSHDRPVAPGLPGPRPGGECAGKYNCRFRAETYPGYMTIRQAPKRPGYMNPTSRLLAALNGRVVAG